MDLNWGSVPDWIGVALTVLIALGLGGALYRARKGTSLRWRHQKAEAIHDQKRKAANELAEMRRQVVLVAKARGIVAPETVTGTNPLILLKTDGVRIPFYRDHQSLMRAQRGSMPNIQARTGTPPVPISRWSRERCEQWLREHAD